MRYQRQDTSDTIHEAGRVFVIINQQKGLVIKMKAAVFYGRHDIRIEEVKTPEPGPGDVLIRVMASGVC